MTEAAVFAAGGVVWRVVDGKLRILVIHRTAYADVTLPKGKVDPGETLAETAVREIFEETGIAVHLGIPVGVSRYRMAKGRQKIVHYWAAEATDKAIRASAFVPNKEIAAIEWVSPRKARGYLSYPVDVEILDQFLRYVDDGILSTFPIIVLRHAKACGFTTKTGLMLGLGERPDEIEQCLRDLVADRVDILTIGQYLQPTPQHLPVDRWVTPDEFRHWRDVGLQLGFGVVESAPLVRSSYHADEQSQKYTGEGHLNDRNALAGH